MDKNQELNLRLTILVKALEGRMTPEEMGFANLKEAFDWVAAPSKNMIVPAAQIVTQ